MSVKVPRPIDPALHPVEFSTDVGFARMLARHDARTVLRTVISDWSAWSDLTSHTRLLARYAHSSSMNSKSCWRTKAVVRSISIGVSRSM